MAPPPSLDEKRLVALGDRLKALESLGRANPFEDPTIQLALEDGGTVSARTRSEVIDLAGFQIKTGAPNLAVGTNSLRWQFDQAADEAILTMFVVPEDYVGGGVIRLYYTMSTSVAGFVRWYIMVAAKKEGESLSTTGTTDVVNDAPQAGGAALVGILDIPTNEELEAGDVMNLRVGRSGAHAGDTSGNDAFLHAVTLRYTAFF